jgi:hypothetical protein
MKLFLRWARTGWARCIVHDMRVRRDLAVKDLPLNRSTHGPQTGLWEVKDRVLSGWSATLT